MKPYDVCDFNKNCEENRGKIVPLSLQPVYYYRCEKCGFLNAPEICSWPRQKFTQYIYNNQYIEFDPDFATKRPNNQASMIVKAFGFCRSQKKPLA